MERTKEDVGEDTDKKLRARERAWRARPTQRKEEHARGGRVEVEE